MEKAFHQLGQRFLANTEHLHRDWCLVQTYALSPALRGANAVVINGEGTLHNTLSRPGARRLLQTIRQIRGVMRCLN